MARETFRIDGLKELDRALGELPKSMGKSVLRRVLRNRAQPIAEDYRNAVRVDQGDLKRSIGVGTKLTRRQRSQHRRMFRDNRASVEMFVGAGGLAQAITEEFGTVDQSPHPGLRPAWDAGKGPLLSGLKADLWSEVRKAAARHAKRQARAAAKAAKGR